MKHLWVWSMDRAGESRLIELDFPGQEGGGAFDEDRELRARLEGMEAGKGRNQGLGYVCSR